jgi:arylsulfatase A-like enzyme
MDMICRRNFLKLVGAGVLASMAPQLSGKNPRRAKRRAGRPNIVFIMSDDHAAHAISAYGCKITTTPNIDRLAKEGMRFTHALGVNSLCAPARAALITGKHSFANGKHTNHDRFDARQQTFPKLLQVAGYETAIVGKWHLGGEPTGFDFYKVMRGHGTYLNCAFRQTGSKGMKTHKGYLTNAITDSAIDWLSNRSSDKPFCLMVHHKAPHGPDIHEPRHARLHSGETIPEPATLHDDWATREPLATGECGGTKLINCTWRQDIYRKLLAAAPKEKKARTSAVYQQMIKGYLRLTASLDENVGRLLDHLDKAGLRDNTLVIYTSDNGFFLGDHGMYNKMWMYEESMRVPMLVRYPGVVKPGSVNGDLVSMLDIAPTFLDLAGARIPADMHGRSINPLLAGRRPDDWRQGVYYHFYGGYGVPAHYGIRTKTHKLLHFPKFKDGDYWELFDLAQDAVELNNVYNKPENKAVVAKLRKMLTQRKKALKIPAVKA